MASVKGKSIVIFSAKGGVGKTTTVLNLAGIFESLKKKILIIDYDLYGGGINVALNIISEKNIYHLADDLNNNRYKDLKNYVSKYDEYIDILGGPKDPRQANKINYSYTELIIDRATYLYDIILIDTTHMLNETNLTILSKVDKILFMVTNDPYDLKNMKSILSIFKDLNFNNYKLLLNNSREKSKNYFSSFDIKTLLKTDIDYELSNNFYFSDIDSYVMKGKIITLEKKILSFHSKDYATLVDIATDMLKDGENNE